MPGSMRPLCSSLGQACSNCPCRIRLSASSNSASASALSAALLAAAGRWPEATPSASTHAVTRRRAWDDRDLDISVLF